jgi:thymidine phosphorylase
MIRPAELIEQKRDGGEHDPEELAELILAYARDEVPDYQLAAWCMAVYFRGLSAAETDALTDAMIRSGETLDLGALLGRKVVDKHSTGGVGDKTSIAVGPIVAACGVPLGKMSGRGLGHTGGTLDKLESIPGYRVELSTEEFVDQLRAVGMAIVGQTADLVPADKKLYALRDVTGTVEAIPLIASSIMSKKIAEGTGALVLDVKVGTGAFMKDVDRARELATTMVGLGTDAGVRTVALLTDMSTPLGRTAGNAIEVAESVEVLAGGGPADVVELTVALAREMLALVGFHDADPAAVLAAGDALPVWRALVAAQGGDPDAPLPVSKDVRVVRAERSGVVTMLEALGIGLAAWRLGAGRARKEHPVSPSAGVVCVAKVGDAVEKGQPVLELHLDDPDRLEAALEALAGAITIGDEPPPPEPLVIDVLRP